MEFDPTTQQLTKTQTLYTKGKKLYLADKSNKVKFFFRRVFLQAQYDQSKIFAVFQSVYEKSDHKNVATLDRIQANYSLLIKSGKAKHKCFKNSSCIAKLFIIILFGNPKHPGKEAIDYYKSKIKAVYEINAAPTVALFSKYKKSYSKINQVKDFEKFFQITLNNYLPSLMDRPFKEVSKNFLSFLNAAASLPQDELEATKDKLEEILNLLEKNQTEKCYPVELVEIIAKIKLSITDIEIQIETTDFQKEFGELTEEYDSPYIFYSLTAFAELQVPNLSDFVQLVNSHLPTAMQLELKKPDSMDNYTAVLKAISLLEVKDYVKNKIFSVDAFEAYIQNNAQQIRDNIRYLV